MRANFHLTPPKKPYLNWWLIKNQQNRQKTNFVENGFESEVK